LKKKTHTLETGY